MSALGAKSMTGQFAPRTPFDLRFYPSKLVGVAHQYSAVRGLFADYTRTETAR